MKHILPITLSLLINTAFAEGNYYSRASLDDLLAQVAQTVQTQ